MSQTSPHHKPSEIQATNVIKKVPNHSNRRSALSIDEYSESRSIESKEGENDENSENMNFSENEDNQDNEEIAAESEISQLKKKKLREIDVMCKDANESTQDFEDGRDSLMEKVANNTLSLTDSLTGEISPMELLDAQFKLEQQKSEKLEEMLKDERERIAQLEKMLHEELQKNDKLQEELDQANETIKELKKNQKGNNSNVLQKELDRANKKIEELEAELEKSDNSNAIGLLKEENASLMEQVEQLQNDLNKKQKQQGNSKLEYELKHAKDQISIKDARIEQLNKKNQALSEENENLQEQIEKLRSNALNNRPNLNKQPHKVSPPSNSNEKHSRIPTRETRDPSRFGFKPRPTSAEDHLKKHQVPRFPKNGKGGSEDENSTPSLGHHKGPVLTKPKEDSGRHGKDTNDQPTIIKRPKLGALKDPDENEHNNEDFVEDDLGVKVNKVDVTFGDDKNENKTPSPPAKRALADNIKFEDNDEASNNDSSKSAPRHNINIPQQPEKVMPNRHAMMDNIKFTDDSIETPSPQQRKGLGSQISFGQSNPTPNDTNSSSAYPSSGLSKNEILAKVDKLNLERMEIERQLNKALPKEKASVITKIKKEREVLEKHLEDVVKDIAKLKLELKFADKK